MRSGEEIRAALVKFAAKWGDYDGSEKAEAQTFLNELFAAYGTDRLGAGARFEDFKTSAGFMDLHWPGNLIVEMKAPGVPVASARDQVERYWRESADDDADVPAARWVLICNFGSFELWEPGRFPAKPRYSFTLKELPDRYDALLFMADSAVEPIFIEHHRHLSREAAKLVADLYHSLLDRAAAPVNEVQRFVLQSVWCLYAEDLLMLEDYPMQNLVARLRANPNLNPAAEFQFFFTVLNQKGNHNRTGHYSGTRYVNGDLFSSASGIALNQVELKLLASAAEFDWRQVDPTIFGSLLEGVLGPERRSALGAHYTHEADIMKVVTPTIIRPWRKKIDAVGSPQAGVFLLHELCAFTILDPACGCGNFLYVAYREMRALESELKAKIKEVSHQKGLPVPAGDLPYYPLRNLYGLEIEPVAVLISRLTLWMGQRQMIDRFGLAEDPLPLVDMSSIKHADSLQIQWPEVDAIIGNPPFLGSQFIRSRLGDDYADWLAKRFKVGIKDLVTYWFRIAQDHLKPGQRAGLVATNSVSQNRARSASLDYIVSTGGVITDAVSSQKWPGDAKVHVSIVNWIKKPADAITECSLDGSEVPAISSSLTSLDPHEWTPAILAANKARCFQGPIPVGAGFIVSDGEARRMLEQDPKNEDVVRPYLNGEDIAERPDQSPSRWIIDFGLRTLEEARHYAAPLDIVRSRVRPARESNNRKLYRDVWWLFGENRPGMRRALSGLDQFISGAAQGKRLIVAFQDARVCPSNLTNVFAFDDEYSMGVLLSRTHEIWAWHQSSTLKGDLRYTPTSVFATFPWPDPVTPAQRERVAALSRAVVGRRQEICLREGFGLTKLYNLVDDGAYADLKKLHRQLDEAVAECYGWPRSAAQDSDEIARRLTQLNREISEGTRTYAPFSHDSQQLLEGSAHES
ncbi:DNA modification methyltransferase [Sinomonas cyclohexanicum]|uniref:site-specific DNA-methyltransferase (adenine-specific) n=1 Tax=Sinomonas cyclohexanicum TaxID=322009 RepID=A0ABM7Q129_SINCY|nr:DNA methyltransferase [Corynebacterium cyclohexanicum]BCT78277.1 DNA modification methyltransferase [Corynebacterium cyclohexanicum]